MRLPQYGELDIRDINALNNCCGVTEVGGFEYYDHDDEDVRPAFTGRHFESSGTGLFVSTFVNNEDCRVAYEFLIKEHKLLYQSPLYKNTLSGSNVFLCVFLHSDMTNKFKARRGERLPKL